VKMPLVHSALDSDFFGIQCNRCELSVLLYEIGAADAFARCTIVVRRYGIIVDLCVGST
jgi:hypothetical protein